MNRQEVAELVLESLRAGVVPWQHPANARPEFRGLFGMFSSSEPQGEAEANYGELDRLIGAVGVKIVRHGKVRKPRCERPPKERILLPPRSRFLSESQYRATVIHEVLHALEQPHRVGWVGSDHQAELVAEVGTGFVLSHLRLPPDLDTTNIRKWLPAWVNGIKADPDYLFDAVPQAERAARYLLELRRVMKAAQIERSHREDRMAEHGDQKNDRKKRLPRDEYDRLVQGCDDYFFGGADKPEGDKKPSSEPPPDEPPKNQDDGK